MRETERDTTGYELAYRHYSDISGGNTKTGPIIKADSKLTDTVGLDRKCHLNGHTTCTNSYSVYLWLATNLDVGYATVSA